MARPVRRKRGSPDGLASPRAHRPDAVRTNQQNTSRRSDALTLSGGILALQRGEDVNPRENNDDSGLMVDVGVLIFATSFGVAWEVLEFATGPLSTVIGGEPLLAQYGPSGVVLDLLFNTIGALMVAPCRTSYFDAFSQAPASRLEGGH